MEQRTQTDRLGKLRSWFSPARNSELTRTQKTLHALRGYLESPGAAAELPAAAVKLLRLMHASARAVLEQLPAVTSSEETKYWPSDLSHIVDRKLPQALADFRERRRNHRPDAEIVLRAGLPLLAARLLTLVERVHNSLPDLEALLHRRADAPDDVYVQAARLLHMLDSGGPSEIVAQRRRTRPAAELGHQRALLHILRQLDAWAGVQGGPSIAIGPMPIVFSRTCVLQPDLMLWLEPLSQEYSYPIHEVPDLVVDVLSCSDHVGTQLDFGHERSAIYNQAGVSEYWLVDVRRQLIQRWSDDSPRYETYDEEELVSDLLPGFRLDLGKVWENCVTLPLGATSVCEPGP